MKIQDVVARALASSTKKDFAGADKNGMGRKCASRKWMTPRFSMAILAGMAGGHDRERRALPQHGVGWCVEPRPLGERRHAERIEQGFRVHAVSPHAPKARPVDGPQWSDDRSHRW